MKKVREISWYVRNRHKIMELFLSVLEFYKFCN